MTIDVDGMLWVAMYNGWKVSLVCRHNLRGSVDDDEALRTCNTIASPVVVLRVILNSL